MITILQTMSEVSGSLLFFSLVPVIMLILLLGVFKQPGHISAFATLVVTALISVFVFDFGAAAASLTIVYGILKAVFPILIIILMAMYGYNVLVMTKAIEVIKKQLSSISSDQGIQVLLLTWGFGGLLEGMAGFGTAVAIPAAILIGLGHRPIFAALVSLIANSVATGFGAVGTPVVTLAKETGMTETITALSADVIIQLAPLMFLIPFVILHLTDKSKVVRNIVLSLLVGAVSLISQYYVAAYVGAETPAIIGSVLSMVVILLYVKFTEKSEPVSEENKILASESFKAWSVYLLIVVLILGTSNLLPFKAMLAPLASTPITITLKEALVKKVAISWLTDTGTLLFLGAFIGGLIQGATVGQLFSELGKTLVKLNKTAITICSLVALSSIMDFSGMVGNIGLGLALTTGSAYPFFAAWIGCLGTFLTGSDTASNILFGKLQTSVAAQIGADPQWLAAANTAGATGGKIISPQSIAVATTTCNQQGKEGEIMKSALPYAVAYIFIAGVIIFLLA